MPSYDPTRARFLSEIGKLIPRNWNKPPPIDNSRLSSLLNSLKDFTIKGQISEAFSIFALIRLHVLSSSHSHPSPCEVLVLPISSLLEACTDDSRLLCQGLQIHCQAICLGVYRHPYLVRKLVTFYSAFNRVFDAHCVAESCFSKDPVRWNVVISGYVRNGLFQEALMVYRKMLDSGIRPDSFTFSSVLKACGEEMDLSFGREIHRRIADGNRKESVYVQNALISLYGKCGEVRVAREVFDEMTERDAVSWNSIFSVYASKGLWEEAFECVDGLVSEVGNVSVVMCNDIASVYLQTGKFVEALRLLSKLRRCDICLDEVGSVTGLRACSHVHDLGLGQQFHASCIRGGCDGYRNVKHALITMYSRCNDLKDAYILFQVTDNKSLITWNAIISGYAYWDRIDEASFLFREMLLSGFEPNYVTIASILPVCGRVASLQLGRELHCYILRRRQLNGYLVLWNSMIDMYARSGKIRHAKRVFDSLSEKNVVAYTSLMFGYGGQGQGDVALELFKEMTDLGIKPDHITLLAVLSACNRARLLNIGQLLFERMESEYGISPRLEHFDCMVDIFKRAGHLWKAEEIIRKMPYHHHACKFRLL